MRAARRALAPALAVLALALLVRTAVTGAHEVADALAHPDVVALVVLFACGAAAMGWVALQWSAVLAALDAPVAAARSVALYFAGEIGKYVPGGIWPVVGRAELATRERDAKVSRPVAYASVLLSLAYLFLAGLLCAAAAGTVVLAGDSSAGAAAPLLLLLLLPLGLACLHPRVAGRAFALALRGLRRDPSAAPRFPRWGESIALVVRYAPAWAGIGGATYAAAHAVGAAPGVALLVLATCLSWVAGFLLVPAPGGLGAREAVFAAVLGTSVAHDKAAAAALLARLAFVVVDGVGALASFAWLSAAGRRRGAKGTSGRST